MFLFCSWLNSMSTCAMILWKNARKKLKSSSSSILSKPPASHSCIKFTILSDGPKTFQEVVLVLKNGVNSTTVKVPPCWWSSRKSVCHHFIKHSGSLGWPGEKRSKTTQIWSKKHRPWWCGMLPAALSGWADEHNSVGTGHSRTRL